MTSTYSTVDKRKEKRTRSSWPVWFGFEDNGELFCGKMVDFSKSSVSFTVDEYHCPSVGNHVVTRFSFPRKTNSSQLGMGHYLHWSEVIRVDDHSPGHRRVAMRLHQPLVSNPQDQESGLDRA